MKKSYLLFLVIISMFMMSCGGHFFNPRYYYGKNDSQTEAEQEIPSDIGIGSSDVPADQDPFKVGEWNTIDYKFDGKKILDFLFAASFDGKNVPVYSFFKDGTQWVVSDAATAEKKYNAKDGVNKAQGYDITAATFYRYDAKNPLVAPESDYNTSERMERFVFYRLVGKAVVVPLNNYLIAVDTYSKLVFAYGKITKTGSTMGQAYPTAFEAVELHGDKRPFYEYDPIGFMSYDEVNDSMTLTLYREYQEEMAVDANAFFPKIHDSTRAVAGYEDKESAGLSPYYYVNVADIDPATILDEFKGKTYSIRSGLTLYTYIFSNDGKTVQIIKDHFYDGETFNEKYTFTKVTGATSLQYGDITITGLDSYAKVRDSINNVDAELDYADPGPEFIYRVRGKVFDAKDGSYSYKFTIDGKTIEYYVNGQFVRYYAFVQQDASDRAIYKEERSGSFAYWGLRLADDGDTKDGILYWSSGAGDTPGLTSSSGVSSNPGYLNVDESVIDFFTDAVANKVYAFRDYEGTPGDGKSLTTFEYRFSGDGKTITYTEESAKKDPTSVTYTLVKDNGKSAVYSLNGVQYTFTLENAGEDLWKNDEPAAELGFRDKGPYFLDVVVNTTYYSMDGSYKYEFDGSGNLTYTYPSGEKATYTITDKYGSSQADYTKAAYIEDGALVFKYWALRLGANGTMIQMSTGALADANHILNSAAYGYDAYITGKDGQSVDRFMSVVAGETYRMRVSDNIALMQYYTFSKAGNYITHVVTNTQTGKETSSNMYYNYTAIDKQFNGKYEQMTPKQSKTFTIKNSDNELYMDNVIVGYKNYDDSSFEFMSRVAGKTYTTDDNTKKYVFSANGDYFDFYVDGNKNNTFSYESHSGNVGKYTTGGLFGTDVSITLSDYKGVLDGQIQDGSITAHVYVASKFTDNVKSKTYKFRDTTEYVYTDTSKLPDGYTKPTGKSLILYSYEFDPTGQKLTYKEETWNGGTKQIDYTLKEETESMGTYTSQSNGDIKVSIQGSPDILYKLDGSVSTKVGEASFKDPEPIFPDRVRGAKFEKGSVLYTFNDDGTQFTIKDGSSTLTFILARYNNDSYINNSAVYEYQEEWTVFKYRWVELSDNNTIKTSTSGFTVAAPGSTMGFEATRK
ncbi:hypothetical protein Q5M87_01030 [Brachyspira innocens]|uniref:Uncharacterized protein n=1 Tax=Brachyspira innocens TaxID=13264 RepID=A0ABT8YXD6_9SPIR|nr:hypothetical protein [Brachyspira innocens]MDO6992585.1 hypothetical protein [Brachyspira innocens]MDO7019892.1 hypothetical protein [Brachyspira innocens]